MPKDDIQYRQDLVRSAITIAGGSIAASGGSGGGGSSSLTASRGLHHTVDDLRLGDLELSPALGDWLGYDSLGDWTNVHRVPSVQTAAIYTIDQADRAAFIVFNRATAVAVTLPQASATFPAGWWVEFTNIGAGLVTITPTTSTIDGLSSLAIAQYQGAEIMSDGTNYYTQRGLDSTIPSALDIIGWQRSWMGI